MRALLRAPRDMTRSSEMHGEGCSPPRYLRLPKGYPSVSENQVLRTRKGYVPVLVGDEGYQERFMVPTQYMKHPSIVALFDLVADEFGYNQPGVLRIPVEPDYFRDTINSIPSSKKKR